MPFNIHAVMKNSDDGDHFATDLEIDRMPAGSVASFSGVLGQHLGFLVEVVSFKGVQ